MQNVIDITTGLPLDLTDRNSRWAETPGFPPTKNFEFVVGAEPKRMIRVTTVVPAECAALMMKQWFDVLSCAGKIQEKVKPARRRAARSR